MRPCPYKKRSGHRRTLRDDHVGTQGGDGRLHGKQRGLEPRPHSDLDSGLQDGDSKYLWFSPPGLWDFVMAATGHEYRKYLEDQEYLAGGEYLAH